jgi:hypothetical protein
VAVKASVFEEMEWYATLEIQIALARHVAMRNDRGMVNICRASKHLRAVLQPWMGRYSGAFLSGVRRYYSRDIFWPDVKIPLDMSSETI